MDYVEAILRRADELMVNAPGRVVARRISQIDEVRALRAAKEALSEEEAFELAKLRLRVVERLNGALSSEVPSVGAPKNMFQAVLALMVRNFESAMQPQSGEYQNMVRKTGGPVALPAPAELIDAAEAWALSYIAADRVDNDLSVLRREWDEASIHPL